MDVFHKYTKIKWFHMWLHMNMKKGPILDFFDFVVTVLVCIVWNYYYNEKNPPQDRFFSLFYDKREDD
jgi:hypothetical protein